GEGQHGRREPPHVPLPAHDGQAHAHLVRGQQHRERGQADRVQAPVARAEQPAGEHDAGQEVADPDDDGVDQAPAHPAPYVAVQVLVRISGLVRVGCRVLPDARPDPHAPPPAPPTAGTRSIRMVAASANRVSRCSAASRRMMPRYAPDRPSSRNSRPANIGKPSESKVALRISDAAIAAAKHWPSSRRTGSGVSRRPSRAQRQPVRYSPSRASTPTMPISTMPSRYMLSVYRYRAGMKVP